MGLLDDAIREHLDLKRRRGADPTEVERQEREVLGPVRPRGEPGFDDPGLAHEDDLEHEPLPYDEPWDEDPAPPPRAAAAFDYEDDEDEREPRYRTEPVPPPFPESYEQGVRPVHVPDPYGAGAVPEPPGHDPYGAGATPHTPDPYATGAVPEPPTRYVPEPQHPGLDQETAEFSIEESRAAEGGEEEDVLEETPDFLQDTPDHDRLWFEQRPPRDFDFDG